MNRAERRALQFGFFTQERPFHNNTVITMLSLDRDQVDAYWESWCISPRTFFEEETLWLNTPETAYAYRFDGYNRRIDGVFYE